MRVLIIVLSVLMLLCGSASAGVYEVSPASGGVSLENGGFDIAQNYSLTDGMQVTTLAEMGMEIYDVTPDLNEWCNWMHCSVGFISAEGGYAFLDVRNKLNGECKIIRVDCTTGETSLYKQLYTANASIDYADSEYLLYTIPESAHTYRTSYLYSSDGVQHILELQVKQGGSVARVGNTLYYDGELYVTFDNYEGEYTLPVIYQYNIKTGSNSVFKFNASDVRYGGGQLSFSHYLSLDNIYSARHNYVDYTHYDGGSVAGYTYRIKENNLFGDRYALGYYVGGRDMVDIITSKNGAKPRDLHITKNGIAAFNTSTILSENAAPIVMDIYNKKLASVNVMPNTCDIVCDNMWLYFVKSYIAIDADGGKSTLFRIVSLK